MPMTARGGHAGRRFTAAVVIMIAGLVSGCDVTSVGKNVSNPMTPEESKSQVVGTARGLIASLKLQPVGVYFHHESCNDQNEAPFRGVVNINYPKAASFEVSDAEVARMLAQLQTEGWTGDSEFKSHGSVLKKDNVVAVFSPQNASAPNRMIVLYGECRDVTSTKNNTKTEDITGG